MSVAGRSLLGDAGELGIWIKPDTETGTITKYFSIRSCLVLPCLQGYWYWMLKEELIDCLGTIAQSGTSKFLKALKVSITINIITVMWFSIEGNKTCDVCKQGVHSCPIILLKIKNPPTVVRRSAAVPLPRQVKPIHTFVLSTLAFYPWLLFGQSPNI